MSLTRLELVQKINSLHSLMEQPLERDRLVKQIESLLKKAAENDLLNSKELTLQFLAEISSLPLMKLVAKKARSLSLIEDGNEVIGFFQRYDIKIPPNLILTAVQMHMQKQDKSKTQSEIIGIKQGTIPEAHTDRFSQRKSKVSVNSYLFNKLPKQFNNKEMSFHCPDGKKHHNVTMTHKNVKKGSSNDYATTDWFKINSTVVDPKYANRLYRVIILAGEIFRLIDINSSPKYRVFSEEKSPILLSKGIKNPVEYYTYLEKGNHDLFFEGMGRQFLTKVFLEENDNQPGNWYISVSPKQKNHYFYTIDHGQCFAPLTLQFYRKGMRAPPPASTCLTVGDYDNLPMMVDYKPCNPIVYENDYWIEDFKNIGKKPLFLNEKHFTALKLLITDKLRQDFTDLHIKQGDDNKFLKGMLSKRTLVLKNVCQKSQAFKDYLHTNRSELLCVMLYEINEFFNDNRHYERVNFNRTEHLAHIIVRFDEILKEMHEKALNKAERDLLNQYLSMIEKCDLQAIDVVKKFYVTQHMSAYVELANKKIAAMQASTKSNRFFNLKSPLPVEEELKKISDSKSDCEDTQQLFETMKIKEIKDRMSHLVGRIFLKHRGNNQKRQLEYNFLQEIVEQYYLKIPLVDAIEKAKITIPETKEIYKRSSFFTKRNKTLDLIDTITNHVKKI